MVAVAERVCGVRVTEARMRPLRNTIVSLKEELHDAETERRILSEQNCVVVSKKAILKEHVLTLEDQVERLEDRVSFLKQEKNMVLEKGVIHAIDRVIENIEFSKGVHDVCEACEELGFEKGRQLVGCSTSSSKSEVLGPSQVASRAKEVKIALTSFVETDFADLFHLGELDYDGFRQFMASRAREVLPQTMRADLYMPLVGFEIDVPSQALFARGGIVYFVMHCYGSALLLFTFVVWFTSYWLVCHKRCIAATTDL
ncbi:unnamed protein product [Lactuca saligna]|uniref:Uncharacterized protein n=1 Tax=Lactuca saligna TaxID=75948 RepID=A0AA35V6I9_LACSI|nr:unnamed protein product [Lactuca saligna]